MMEILDAVETLCVEATTASSLVRTIMRKTIAVRSQQPPSKQGQSSDNSNKVGARGASGVPALADVRLVVLAIYRGPGNVLEAGVDLPAFTTRISKREFVKTQTAMFFDYYK